MNRPLPLTLAVALTLGSTAAQALGLGGITVKSELNEPLRAEIPVFVTGPEEAKALKANLASAEEFTRVGLSIGAMSVPITFEIIRNSRGEPVIQVTSQQPVREPFLSFILEVNWANGKLLREYSVLLDPPISAPAVLGSTAAVERLPEAEPMMAEPLEPVDEPTPEPMIEEPPPQIVAEEPPAAVAEPLPSALMQPPSDPIAQAPAEPETAMPVEEAPAEPASEPVAETPIEESTSPSEPEIAEQPMSTSLAASEYGPVASGETLWEIASTTRPNEAVTLNQMMLALLRANPEAFYQENVNTLKRGAILRIPGADEIEATRSAQAAAEILNQNRSWIESTRPTLVADASTPSTSSSNNSSGSTNASSRLELVPPASGGISDNDRPGTASGTANAATTAELARTKEALNSAQGESRDLRDRVKELEGLSGKSERLIQLKDSELKALQDRLAAAEKRAADAAIAQATAQGDAATARRLADEAATKSAETQRLADARAAEVAAAAAQPVTVADASPAIDTITDTTTDPTSATVDGSEIADPIATDISGDLSDPAVTDSVDAGTSSTDNVVDSGAIDPISSADTAAETIPLSETTPAEPAILPVATDDSTLPWYKKIALNPMVLGGTALLLAALAALGLYSRSRRKAAAEASEPRTSIAHNFNAGVDGMNSADSVETDLLNALAIDPTDLNAHLNVLEYFYTRRDPEKFEAAAEAMYAQVGDPQVAEWQGALLMGADICPTHPLFSGVGHDVPSGDFSNPFASHSFDTPASVDHDLSFGRATDMPTPLAVPVVPSDADFDFDLVDAKSQSAQSNDELSFDFDLDMDTTSTPNATHLDVPSLDIPMMDRPSTSVSSSMDSTQQMPVLTTDFLGDDAVATKIDLARAYLDMGDADGARSMLEEVLTEGSAGQREEASKLLSEIR